MMKLYLASFLLTCWMLDSESDPDVIPSSPPLLHADLGPDPYDADTDVDLDDAVVEEDLIFNDEGGSE